MIGRRPSRRADPGGGVGAAPKRSRRRAAADAGVVRPRAARRPDPRRIGRRWSACIDDNVAPAASPARAADAHRTADAYDGVNATVTYAKQSRRVAVRVAERLLAPLLLRARRSRGAPQHRGGFRIQSAQSQRDVSHGQSDVRLRRYTRSRAPAAVRARARGVAVPELRDSVGASDEARSIGSIRQPDAVDRPPLALERSRRACRTTDFLATSTGLRTRVVLGRMMYALSRDVSLVFGYGYQRGRYRRDLPIHADRRRVHNIDLGVDYHRALSLSRRTTIGFTTGTTVAEDSDGVTRIPDDRQRPAQPGDRAHLARDGRVQPGRRVHRGFCEPDVRRLVRGRRRRRTEPADGPVGSRRLLVRPTGLAEHAPAMENYNGLRAPARRVVTRRWRCSAEYHIYRYRFDQAAALPTGILPQLDRQGVRVGLEFWLPLIR